MGFVSGILGTAGGAGGSGFAPPGQAKLLNPVTVDQANQANTGSNNAIAQQQALLGALQGQNGIQNQSNVYNQLQGVANGTGPNPAQAQLAQATAANTANQGALMAGQRGSGANAGLIARQAAMQGAANQQNAAGQAATMQANQSLGALGQLGGMANQQVAQQVGATGAVTGANQTQQQNLLNAIGQQNNAAVGSQSSINAGNTQLANTTMQGQQGMLGGLMNGGGAASMMSSLFADGGDVTPPPTTNYETVQTPQISSNNSGADALAGKKSGGGGGGAGLLALLAEGGNTGAPQVPTNPVTPHIGAKSSFGQFLKQQDSSNEPNYGNPGANALYKAFSAPQMQTPAKSQSQTQPGFLNEDVVAAQMGAPGTRMPGTSIPNEDAYATMYKNASQTPMANGGNVPALLSPGEQYLPPKEVDAVKDGKKDPLEAGERIPGTPKYPGNDYRNDTYKKTLKEGGLVIPNEVMQSKNPHWEAMKFVHAHTREMKAKKGKK